jgi:hypothetical protein
MRTSRVSWPSGPPQVTSNARHADGSPGVEVRQEAERHPPADRRRPRRAVCSWPSKGAGSSKGMSEPPALLSLWERLGEGAKHSGWAHITRRARLRRGACHHHLLSSPFGRAQIYLTNPVTIPSLRSRRKHKAWGGAQRNPRITNQLGTMSPRRRATGVPIARAQSRSAVACSAGSHSDVRVVPGPHAPRLYAYACYAGCGGCQAGLLKYVNTSGRALTYLGNPRLFG